MGNIDFDSCLKCESKSLYRPFEEDNYICNDCGHQETDDEPLYRRITALEAERDGLKAHNAEMAGRLGAIKEWLEIHAYPRTSIAGPEITTGENDSQALCDMVDADFPCLSCADKDRRRERVREAWERRL
jgi:hypothetical protein